MLKFEGIPEGTHIRSYDFQPIEGRKEMYVEGTITKVTSENGYKGYGIDCDFDSWDEAGAENKGSRVGLTVIVPMEVSMMEFEERIMILPLLQLAVG